MQTTHTSGESYSTSPTSYPIMNMYLNPQSRVRVTEGSKKLNNATFFVLGFRVLRVEDAAMIPMRGSLDINSTSPIFWTAVQLVMGFLLMRSVVNTASHLCLFQDTIFFCGSVPQDLRGTTLNIAFVLWHQSTVSIGSRLVN